MNINLKKGFFRLWLVVSLVWVAFILGIFLPDTKKAIKKLPDFNLFEKSFNLAIDSRLGKLTERKKEALKELVRRRVLPEITLLGFVSIEQKEDEFKKLRIKVNFKNNIKEFPPGTNIKKIWQDYKPAIEKERNGIILKFCALVFLPPVGLIILGSLLSWILRGFVTLQKDDT